MNRKELEGEDGYKINRKAQTLRIEEEGSFVP